MKFTFLEKKTNEKLRRLSATSDPGQTLTTSEESPITLNTNDAVTVIEWYYTNLINNRLNQVMNKSNMPMRLSLLSFLLWITICIFWIINWLNSNKFRTNSNKFDQNMFSIMCLFCQVSHSSKCLFYEMSYSINCLSVKCRAPQSYSPKQITLL